MSGDENGVVTRTVSSLSILQAIRSAPVTTSRVLRRTRRPDDVTLARHILAWHDEAEAEPDGLNPEPDSSIIEAANATIADLRDDLDGRAEQIAGLRDRCDDLFATVRAKEATITELRQEARTSEALIETLRRELAEAGEANATLREALASPPTAEPILDLAYLEDLTARAAAMKAALERFAAPGAITATDRRKAASEALGAAQGADGEAAP